MPRRLTFEVLATTEDTDDPVLRAEFQDTGSFMDVILPGDHDRIHVWLVESNRTGDMALMLDELVAQLDRNHIWFLTPLDEYKKDREDTLMARLTNFEAFYHEFHDPTADEPDATYEMLVYRGDWDLDYESDTDVDAEDIING